MLGIKATLLLGQLGLLKNLVLLVILDKLHKLNIVYIWK